MRLDEDKLKIMIQALDTPQTITQLMQIANISTRSVYRWLSILHTRGYDVRRININRPTQYQIGGGHSPTT